MLNGYAKFGISRSAAEISDVTTVPATPRSDLYFPMQPICSLSILPYGEVSGSLGNASSTQRWLRFSHLLPSKLTCLCHCRPHCNGGVSAYLSGCCCGSNPVAGSSQTGVMVRYVNSFSHSSKIRFLFSRRMGTSNFFFSKRGDGYSIRSSITMCRPGSGDRLYKDLGNIGSGLMQSLRQKWPRTVTNGWTMRSSRNSSRAPPMLPDE